MKINDISLPYPVLGISDDVYPLLKNDCVSIEEPVSTPSSIQFKIHLRQKNKEITQFIKKGKAEYVCEINCARTFFRTCIRQSTPDFIVELPRKGVSGRIEFDMFVTVKTPIDHYHNSQFNADYDGVFFDMEPGDVLVAFPSAYYNLDVKYDKLYAAGSFMQIANGGDDSRPTWYNISGDKILIMLPPKMFKEYDERISMDRDYIEIIHSSIVFNALVFALYHIDEQAYEGKQWSDAIKYRLATESELKGFDISDKTRVFELAQTLLADPYQRMFNHLSEMKNRGEE